MSTVSRRRGKANQRETARILRQIDKELRNIGIVGEEDLVGKYLVVECKERQKIPKWLFSAFEQLRPERHPTKIHVVQLHVFGMQRMRDLILMSMRAFIELLKGYVLWEESKGEKNERSLFT